MRKVSIYLFVFILTLVSLKAQVEPPLNNGWYEISTLDNLRWISENTISWDKNFKLMNDIDATDTKNWNDGAGFSPISPGYPKYPNQKDFIGIFEGNGKTISNLYINRPKDKRVGLFGRLLVKGPVIRNLNMINCDITGNIGVGAIVGETQFTLVVNVNVQGKVKGDSHVGMLVGDNYGIIKFCTARGEVSGETTYIGGLVGSNADLIHASYAFCSVKGKRYVGGFTGSNSPGLGNAIGCINNCYCVGSVEGDSLVAGFCPQERFNNIGNCFWNIDVAGIDSSKSGCAKTTAEMKDRTMYDQYLWNFDAVWSIDPTVNDGYPFLDVRTKDQGSGIKPIDTDGNNLLNISSLENLIWISSNENSYENNYELDNNIDASESIYYFDGMGLIPFGQHIYSGFGSIYGNYHTIKNLYINRPYLENVGLIAKLTSSGDLGNLSLINCTIVGKKSVGALIGFNQSEITQVSASGTVMGESCVGGLVGSNARSLTISYSECNVIGDTAVGGIVGNNGGGLSNCYSRGAVSGIDFVGGFFGRGMQIAGSWPSAYNCYSSGKVSGKTHVGGFMGGVKNASCLANICFWDIEASGVDTSWSDAVGKTTSEMKTKATFYKEAWDFSKIWGISPEKNDGYPYLLFTDKIVSTEENNSTNNGLSIFPNPILPNQSLNIVFKSDELYSNLKIKIVDYSGRTVDEFTTLGNIINYQYDSVGKLNIGTYFVIIESKGSVLAVEKFIVK